MRPVYAVQFETRPGDTTDSSALRDQVVTSAVNWVTEWYQFFPKISNINFPTDGGVVAPIEGHEILVTSSSLPSGESLWTLNWSYPATDDPNLLWQSHCVVAYAGAATEVSLVIRLESREFSLAPLSFTVQRPRLIRKLVTAFPSYVGARRLSAESKQLAVADMGPFVSDTLLAGNRRLPVVLCSLEPFLRQYLADPHRVSDTLVGLAEVYSLEDQWASFELTDLVGKSYSCFNGAVRVYWPGFQIGDDSFRHRLYLPGKLDELRANGYQLDRVLLRSLAPISVLRFTDGPVGRTVRRLLDESQSAQAAELRRQVEAGVTTKDQLETEMIKVLDEADQLREAKEFAELRVLELEDENAALRQNMAVIADFQRQAEALFPETVGEAPAERTTETVREALDAAAADFSDELTVWKTGQESARASLYGQPDRLYQALLAIKELVEEYRATRKSNKSMGTWEEFFQQRGFKYASQESQTTISRYGDSRIFTDHGVARQFERHLTLGGGDKVNCIQIYFDFDEQSDKAIIAYCGEHLPYASDHT